SSPTAAAAPAPANSASHPSTVKNLTSVICLSDFNILSDECFQNLVPGSGREANWCAFILPAIGVSPEWIPRTGEAHGARPDPCHADQFTRNSSLLSC